MPNTKSAAKAMRQSEKRRKTNLAVKEHIKKSVKEVRKLIKQGKKAEAAEAMRKVMSSLDKAVKKHVIKKGHASRKKSRLTKSIK